jgi:hypothetical protein
MRNRLRWRIATTEAGLASNWFIGLGLPEPTQVEYNDHTTKNPQSEGGVAKHGYHNVKLLWTKLSPSQAWQIRSLVDSAIAGATGTLFMTTTRLDGSNPGVDWIDISGRPDMSQITPEAPIIGASGYSHNNITLTLNNVTVINDPASF